MNLIIKIICDEINKKKMEKQFLGVRCNNKQIKTKTLIHFSKKTEIKDF